MPNPPSEVSESLIRSDMTAYAYFFRNNFQHSLCLSACSHCSPSKLFLLVLAVWPQRIFLRKHTHMHIPLEIWWRNPIVGGMGKEIRVQKG